MRLPSNRLRPAPATSGPRVAPPNSLARRWALPLLMLLALPAGPLRAAASGDAPLPPYHTPFPLPEPRLLSDGFLCTGDWESHPVFSPGGRTLYFVKSSPSNDFTAIVYSRFVDGGWTIPHMASFSGKYQDTDPFITPDGSKLYYSSNRPPQDYIGAEARDNMDLWVCDRATDTTWSEPRNLGPQVNGAANEWFPTVASDGTLYFGSNRPGGRGGLDLWRSQLVNGAYAPAENLGDSVNTTANESEPLIAPDQSWILFTSSGRHDSRGGTDLYVTYRRGTSWSAPRDLGDVVNSKQDESSPHVSPDGEYFFWMSRRSFTDTPPDHALNYAELLSSLRRTRNGLGDIYQIDLKALGLAR